MSRTKKSYFYCWLNSVTKVVCIFFLLLIYCFLGLYVNWGRVLEPLLKIGSSIRQRFHNLKATISLPSLPTKSTWQGFGWECNYAPHNHLTTLGSNQVASFMISLPSLPTKSTWQGFGWECNCAPHNHLATLGSNQVASFMISVLCNEPIQYSSTNTHTQLWDMARGFR